MLRHIVVSSSCFVLACGALSLASVKVQPAEISETRIATLIKKENVFSSDVSRLQVKLNVDGPEIKGATKWGKVKLTEAVDDVGTDLKPKKESLSFGDDLEDINRFGSEEKKTDAFDATIKLDLPARKATAIKSLKGEFQVLAGGEEKTVTLTKLKGMQGKPLTDPALKAAGISGTFTKPSGDDPPSPSITRAAPTPSKTSKSPTPPARASATANSPAASATSRPSTTCSTSRWTTR